MIFLRNFIKTVQHSQSVTTFQKTITGRIAVTNFISSSEQASNRQNYEYFLCSRLLSVTTSQSWRLFAAREHSLMPLLRAQAKLAIKALSRSAAPNPSLVLQTYFYQLHWMRSPRSEFLAKMTTAGWGRWSICPLITIFLNNKIPCHQNANFSGYSHGSKVIL